MKIRRSMEASGESADRSSPPALPVSATSGAATSTRVVDQVTDSSARGLPEPIAPGHSTAAARHATGGVAGLREAKVVV